MVIDAAISCVRMRDLSGLGRFRASSRPGVDALAASII
jgi:hypothetical protein